MGRRRTAFSRGAKIPRHGGPDRPGPSSATRAGASRPGSAWSPSLGPDGPSGMTANAVSVAVAGAAADDRVLRAHVPDARRGRALRAASECSSSPTTRRRSPRASPPSMPEQEKFEGLALDASAPACPSHRRLPRPGSAASCGTCCPGGDHLIGVGEVVDLWAGRRATRSSSSAATTGRCPSAKTAPAGGRPGARGPGVTRGYRARGSRAPSFRIQLGNSGCDSAPTQNAPETCAARRENAATSSAAMLMISISRRTIRSAIVRCSPAGRPANSTSSGSSRCAAPDAHALREQVHEQRRRPVHVVDVVLGLVPCDQQQRAQQHLHDHRYLGGAQHVPERDRRRGRARAAARPQTPAHQC